ncbi:MAG: family 16 glycosylhydrolase [Phycisphaeraceae bacterium]
MKHSSSVVAGALAAGLVHVVLASPAAAVDPSQYDFFEDWSNGINTSKWRVATWSEHGGQTGRDRTYVEDGKLNMVFVNDPDEGYLSSAIQTIKEDFGFGRWESSLKPSDVPGVLNSMYTIDWSGGLGQQQPTRQEIDIEFLTRTFDDQYPGEVWLAMHASGKQSTHGTHPLDLNPSEQFNTWGFEIRPTHLEYFVNDQVLFTYVYAENDIAFDAPYMLKYNVWTSTGWWIDGPPPPGVETTYQIDWVGFTELENLGPMAADSNVDGGRDATDVAAFVLALTNPAAYEATYGVDPAAAGDVNGDGVLDALDVVGFVTLITNHAVPAPVGSAVPEPGTLALVGLGALMFLRRDRRAW